MRSPQERRNNRQNNQRRNNQNRTLAHSRQFESAGPSGKLKGTPKQLIEKYMSLARDYYSSGDDVNAETCKQFAEHYSRLLGFNHPKPLNSLSNNTEKSLEKPEKESKKIEIEVIEEVETTQTITETEKPVKKLSKKELLKAEIIEEKTMETSKRRGRPPKKKTEKLEEPKLPLELAVEEKTKRRGRPKKTEKAE